MPRAGLRRATRVDALSTTTRNARLFLVVVDRRFLTRWSVSGSHNGQLSQPGGIAVDGQGNVYVADFANRYIYKFRQR
jgi:DNA-binding beta-propeller fold protein YncE